MSRPPLHALQGFVATARLGNLSRAAESMHLTISALSHQIRGLEERLGQRLFVRNPRGVTLTADGQRLFDRVADHLDALEHAMRPFGQRRDDVLTVTLMPSFATRNATRLAMWSSSDLPGQPGRPGRAQVRFGAVASRAPRRTYPQAPPGSPP